MGRQYPVAVAEPERQRGRKRDRFVPSSSPRLRRGPSPAGAERARRAEQAELLASTVDTGQLAALAAPTLIGQRRVPVLKLRDDRVIRLLETLLHPGGFIRDWTTRQLHTRVVARHHLAADDCRLSQHRYDFSKLRAKRLVERIGNTRRYRLTPVGLKLGVLLVKLRTRLLGPLASLTRRPNVSGATRHANSVDAAFHEVDVPLDHLSAALGL